MITLNIYGKNNKVEKTYSVDAYDVKFGVAEDLIDLVNLDELTVTDDINANLAIVKSITGVAVKGMDIVKPLLKDIFPGLTDDEIRNTTIADIAGVILQVVSYTIGEISNGNSGKNVTGA